MAESKKIIPKLFWGIVAVGGIMSLYGLLTQPMFGASLANIPAYGVAFLMLVFGSAKAFDVDVVKMVSFA